MKNVVSKRNETKKTVNEIVAGIGKKINLNKFSILDNPDIILKKGNLNQKLLIETYNDPQVSAAMELRKSQVQKLKWNIDAGSEGEGATVFIKNIIDKWNMPQIISGLIDARAWGFTTFEYIWLQDDYQLKIVDIVQKPSYWFTFDANSQLRFPNQKNYNSLGDICDRMKFLLVQNNATYDNPYGISLLSRCYWLVFFKKNLFKIWFTFIEKYGMPHFIGRAGQASKVNIESFFQMLEMLKQDGVGVIGQDDSVEKIAGNDTSSKEIYESFMAILDKQISKVILNHSDAIDATKGQLGNTSKALSTLDVIAMADKELVENSINDVINLIMYVNFGTVKHMPKFEMYEVSDVDLDLANRDKILSETGVQFTKEYYINSYGFKDTDFEIKAPTPQTPKAFSEAENKINVIVNEMFAPFMEILDKTNDYTEAKKQLFKKFNNMSETEIEVIMNKLMLQASQGITNAPTL